MRGGLAAIVVALLCAACGRLGFDPLSGGSGGDPDGGVLPTPDAFTGCDSGCETGTATLQFFDEEGAPVADIEVIVSFPDGSFASLVTSDSTGLATIEVVPSSMVTLEAIEAVLPAGGQTAPQLFTVAGIQPGDQLVFGSPDGTTIGTSTEIDVTLPGAVTNATSYRLGTGCNGTTSTTSATDTVSVFHDDTCATNVLVAAARDDEGVLLAWTETTIPVPIPPILTLPAWQTSLATGSITATNFAEPAQVTIAPLIGEGEFSAAGADVLVDGATTFPLPAGFGDRWSITTNLPVVPATGEQTVLTGTFTTQVVDQFPTDVVVDAGDGLPLLGNFGLDTTAADRPLMSWTSAANLSDADTGLVLYAWDSTASSGQWFVYVPPGTGSFQFPELPDTHAQLRPDAEAFEALVLFVDLSYVNGYDVVRATPGLDYLLAPFGDPFSAPVSGPFEVRATVTGVFSFPTN